MTASRAETTMGRRKIALDPAEVEHLAAQGLAEYQIAETLGVSQDTLDRRKQDAAEIAETLQRGRSGARGEIENVAFRCARKAEEDPRYQVSMIFWLKTRAGWSERSLFEWLDVDLSLFTDEELERIADGEDPASVLLSTRAEGATAETGG